MLERITKDPQAFFLIYGWASVPLNVLRGADGTGSLYEHLQARILERIEKLDELERETGELKTEAERIADEARELVGGGAVLRFGDFDRINCDRIIF